jgi:acetyltransferase-like isoleucine patch superfamily enzyme
MTTLGWDDLVARARRGEGPLKHARSVQRALLDFRLPVFRPLAALLYAERDLRWRIWPLLAKILYREPLLRYRAEHVGRRLMIEGSLPWITGNGRIRIGDDVTIGGENSWTVGFKVSTNAELIIGDNVYIGHHTTLSVAKSVRIGANTMFASRVQVYDNVTHPLAPERRLRHESFAIDEASPVVIGENCWIGHSAIIMRGITIGDNSVIGAAAVVTRDVPPNSFAAGNPARIIRSLVNSP